MKKLKIVSIIVWVVSLIFTVIVVDKLPDQIASSYGINGEIRSYLSKYVVLIVPFIALMMFALKRLIARIDPRSENFKMHKKTYEIILYVIIIFLCLIQLFILDAAYYSKIRINFLIMLIGFLFILIGNWMPKLKSNFSIGIKTPWTLSSEEVWYKTHRLGGRVFVISGIALVLVPIIMSLLDINNFTSLYVLIIIVIISCLITIPYSYFVYKKSN